MAILVFLCYGEFVKNSIGLLIFCFASKQHRVKYKFGLFLEQLFEPFTVNIKLAEMAVLASKDLTTAKKVTSGRVRPDARDYYWFRSPMPNQLS